MQSALLGEGCSGSWDALWTRDGGRMETTAKRIPMHFGEQNHSLLGKTREKSGNAHGQRRKLDPFPSQKKGKTLSPPKEAVGKVNTGGSPSAR